MGNKFYHILFAFACLSFWGCEKGTNLLFQSQPDQSELLMHTRHDALGNSYTAKYTPHLNRERQLRSRIKNNSDRLEKELSNLKGHHFMSAKITLDKRGKTVSGLEPNGGINNELIVCNSEIFKKQIALIINGALKPCVLHHAYYDPMDKQTICLELVFQDKEFVGQSKYFNDHMRLKLPSLYDDSELLYEFNIDNLNHSVHEKAIVNVN